MGYDANYWNSGQFNQNIPNEGPQVNQPQINDTNQGWFNTAGIQDWYSNLFNPEDTGQTSDAIQGPGLPFGMQYGEFQGPYTNEWYDKQGIVPADKDYVESIPKGTYGDKGQDNNVSFDVGAFGEGLVDLANQQSYDYKLF